ncbi:MAG: hypothetical protein ACFBSG_11710 [Leptolyngbyaceae cyanobacterium]
MATVKARTLKVAYRVCDVRPLTPDQQDYYVPFAARQDAISHSYGAGSAGARGM